MGNLVSKEKQLKVLILGLDSAGKSTLLYQIKNGRKIDMIPTIGYNMESIKIKDTVLTMWDVGGQEKIRLMWKNYYVNISILVYIIDASDRQRLEESRDALSAVLSDPLMDDSILLIYANKQDMEEVASAPEIKTVFGLESMNQRTYMVQPSCAVTGHGVLEGMEWAVNEAKKKSNKFKKGGKKPMNGLVHRLMVPSFSKQR